MADIITKPATPLLAPAAVTVATKANLTVANSWAATAGLECDALAIRVNGLSSAKLLYRAGHQVAQIGQPFANCPPLDLVGKFCRIQIDGSADWTGLVVDENRVRSGVFIDADDGDKRKYRAQDQVFTVAGLEYLLDRRRIDSAITNDGTRLGRSIAFNAESTAYQKAARKQRGNRTSSTNTAGYYEFDDAPGGSEWTAANIVEYLLKYFGPVDDSDNELPTEFILSTGGFLLLSDYKPTLDPTGLTVKQALDQLLHPSRGWCWWVEYSEDTGTNGQAIVHVQSLASADITLPSGDTLPQNSDQQSLDFDLDETCESHRLTRNLQRRYNRVRCRGARMTSTFTVGFGDSTLADDWGSTLETAYKNAASSTTGYGGLTDDEKAARNDAFRRSELLDRVFKAFRVPAAWDQKCGDGGATSPAVTRNWAFADIETTGSILGGLPTIVNNIRVLQRTLLEVGVNYADPTTPVDNNPSGTELDLRAPFAIVKVATSPDKWQFADKLTQADWADGTEVGDIKSSYHLYAQQQAPGVVLRSSSGDAHACALNHWTSAEPTGRDPEIDYEDMIVTLSAEADKFAEGVYPASVTAGEWVDELVIELGDDYRLDFLADKTVVDVDNGDLVLATPSTNAGRLLRDDRERLEDAARMAYEWYQDDRVGLDLTLGQTSQLFTLGTLVTTIGDGETLETINTVVGSIAYDFVNQTQTVATLGDAINLPRLLG